MTGHPLRLLTLAATTGAGLVAGVLFAFSTFVMPALRRLPTADAVRSMQAINKAAPNSVLFMLALFGTAAVSLGLGVAATANADLPHRLVHVVGCALYLATVVITAAYHVPHNDQLATVDPLAGDAARLWNEYLSGWTWWNHVRTTTSLAGAVTLAMTLRAP